jgi:hypothetical protein
MDLYKAIRELYQEKAKLDQVIASLEQLASGGMPLEEPPKKRGRKSMNATERRAVSERMKKYWEARRGAASPPKVRQVGQGA